MRVNLPSSGDSFDVQAQYCRGWSGRCIINSSSRLADQTFGLVNGSRIGLAWVDDAFMANSAAAGATQLQLPAAWNIYAGIQHYWVPNLRTPLYGGYVNYRADSSAVDTLVCKPNGFGAGCADWAAWQIGSLPTYPFGAALARAIRECPPATSDWARFEFICNCRGDICQWK